MAVFGVSLFGLVVLFWCKTLEVGRGARTPLTVLRRVGDPILTETWVYYRARFRKLAFASLRVFLLWISAVIHKIEAMFYVVVHSIATHLNWYLRTRRHHMRRGGEVSAHLKTVLEKTKGNTDRSDSN